MTALVQCIGCKRFTVQPRKERQDLDNSYRARGMGRCLIDRLSARWLSAEAERQCLSFVAIHPEQIAGRRRHLLNHRET